MFGFQGGESAGIVVRKKICMMNAQQKWRFLTTFDCSSIKTEDQLCSMIRMRSGISEEQARWDIDFWTQGNQF